MKGYEETWAELEAKALTALASPQLVGGLPLPTGYKLSLRLWMFESFGDYRSWNFYRPLISSEYHPIFLLKTVWQRHEDSRRFALPDVGIKHLDKFKPIPTLSFSDRSVGFELLQRCLDEANLVLQHVRSVARLPITIDGVGFGIEVFTDSESEKVEWNSGLPAGDALLDVLAGLL
ncbi:MAG: hypothetical protein WCT03_18955 [Candidatus Obscuribacterales bacterium]|jgi:hypothetical protein